MKKILFSILIIAVIAAIAAGGTMAYFSSTNSIASTFGTATFDVAMSSGTVPLAFDKLIPGVPKVQYVIVANNGDVAAWCKASLADGYGSDALLNALQVKVTVLAAANGGGNYPGGSVNYVSYDGPLVGLHFDNVVAGNPILPGQWGKYMIEVKLPFEGFSPQGTAGCNVVFNAAQYDGQTTGPVQW